MVARAGFIGLGEHYWVERLEPLLTGKARLRIVELVSDWPPLSEQLRGELALVLSDDGSPRACQDRTVTAAVPVETGLLAAA
jgi:hypothetical protein